MWYKWFSHNGPSSSIYSRDKRISDWVLDPTEIGLAAQQRPIRYQRGNNKYRAWRSAKLAHATLQAIQVEPVVSEGSRERTRRYLQIRRAAPLWLAPHVWLFADANTHSYLAKGQGGCNISFSKSRSPSTGVKETKANLKISGISNKKIKEKLEI